jgi:hypothetical protein
LRRTGRLSPQDTQEPLQAGILKFVDAFRVWLKSDKNNSHFTGQPSYAEEDISPSLIFANETGGLLCAVGGEAEERINDLIITTEHGRL